MEQTLVIIKPDGMVHCKEIITIFVNAGLDINRWDCRVIDKETIKDHYKHLLDKPFYPSLESFMTSAPVMVLILEGENAVVKVRELVGETDSTKANVGTIRNLFGTDKQRNAIHASDSIENAKIEINRFFKEPGVKNGKILTKNIG